jgi:hypothetical protein
MADDNDAISLAPPQGMTGDLISIDTGDKGKQFVSSDTANLRAAKARFGLTRDYTDKSQDELKNMFTNGQEDDFRTSVAAHMDINNYMKLRQQIGQMSQARGQVLNPLAIQSLVESYTQPTDKDSVIEKAFADKFIGVNNDVAANNDIQPLKQDLETDTARSVQMLGRDLIMYREYALKGAQDALDRLGNQSWGGWGVDQAKMLIPGYQDLKMRGFTPDVGWFEGGGLTSNLIAQAQHMYSRPFPEFKQWYDSTLSSLEHDNPSLAIQFAQAVIGMSSGAEGWGNITTTGLDLAALPITRILKAGLKATGVLASEDVIRNMVKDTVRAANSGEPIKVAAATGSGDLGEAAIQRSTLNVLSELKGSVDPAERALQELPSGLKNDTSRLAENVGNFGQEATNRLQQEFITRDRNLFEMLKDLVKVGRTPEIANVMAAESTVRALWQTVKDTYPGLRNTVVNVTKPELNEISNTWHYNVIFGNHRAEYFWDKDTAELFAKNYGLRDAEVINDGSGAGWYIRINRPLDETSSMVRDTFMTTNKSESPSRGLNAWFNSLVGRWRTPEETLSMDQRQNRQVATYGPSQLLKLANDELKDIKKLRSWALPGTVKKQKWQDWKDVLERAREITDPVTNERGYFFKSPGELEAHYQQFVGRLPDPQEVRAYFAYTRFVELDRMLRNLSMYRYKARQGVESHRLSLMSKDGQRIFSDYFDGVIRKALPKTDDQIMISVGKNQGSERIQWADKLNTRFRTALDKGIREGKYKVVELWDPDTTDAIAKFSDRVAKEQPRIRYIITDKLDTKQMSYEQIPRRGGGHFDFEADHYIKQPIVTAYKRAQQTFKNVYRGDTTLMALGNRAIAQKMIPFLNEAKNLIKANKLEEARAVVTKNLMMDWNEFHGYFKERKIDGVTHSPRLNLDEDFAVVPRNRLIGDMDNKLEQKYGSTYENGTRRGSLARQFQVQYAGERDVDVLKQAYDRGTKNNPLFQYEDAKMVDPVTSINRAMSRIINSTFMDDYKIFSIEHWLKEAQQHLKLNDINEIWSSPFWHFNEATDKNSFKPGTPPQIVNRLLTQRMQINQFVGVPSTFDTYMHSAAQSLADTIYSKFGPTRLDPSWMLPQIKDPLRFLRSVTFHAKLGMFAIPQLFVQSQVYVSILGIAGLKYAAPGTMGAFLHQLARINPNMLDTLDRVASKMRIPGMSAWKPGEFREAWQALERTGFGNVGGEYAIRDDMFNPQMIKSGTQQFMDWGDVFFREGERNGRFGSWYTAYREFREKNPTGRLTDENLKDILLRADLLHGNMSRASSSILHQGALSIPTQFLSYQMRMAEIFMGKRLTGMERMRMFAWYAGIYGIPGAFGLSGFPLGDYVRRKALDHGYTVGDNWISSVPMEGIPAMIGALITGQGDIHKCTFYNFSERYGIQGFEPLRQALRSDEVWWRILGGATFSTLADAIADTDPFTQYMLSFMREDDKKFTVTPDDYLGPFLEASGVNNAWRMLMALHFGRTMSKKGTYLDNTSPASAIFTYFTGLQNVNINDVFLKGESLHYQEELEKYGLKKFTEEYQKAIRSRDDNPNESNIHMKNARVWLNITGYPPDKIGQAIASASKGYESLIDQMNWEFDVVRAPQTSPSFPYQIIPGDEREQRLEHYRKSRQMEQLRGQ